jgi:hypothetical protein
MSDEEFNEYVHFTLEDFYELKKSSINGFEEFAQKLIDKYLLKIKEERDQKLDQILNGI